MTDQSQPLSESERAELEALRAEKAAREEAARERAELEELRASRAAQQRQSAQAQAARAAEQEEDRRIREARARGAQLMEPGDDLSMPMGQRIVLGVLAIVVAIIVGMTLLTSK